ncbi:MAG: metallophosphoesterase family protein, partial [Polyangiaceae bacterium]
VKDLIGAPGDFLVNSGDLVANGAQLDLWQRFFDIEGPLLRDRCLFAAIGNHELLETSGANFLRYFGEDTPDATGLRKLYRTVRWENTRFFFLNGTDEFTTSDERHWIDGELAKTDNEANLVWRIVIVHHGPWSSSLHGNNPRLWNGGMLDIFKAHHIDLIVSGHDHVYERGESHGMAYLVSGGGGAPLYPIGDPLKSTRKGESSYHYIEAKIDGDTFSMTAKRIDGALLEACGFKKGSDWDCDSPSVHGNATSSAASSTASSGGTKSSQNPDDSTTSDKSSKCGCKMPGTGESSPFAWLGVLVSAALLRRRKA